MESISAPNNICANCGKGEEESDNLKNCSACLSVKYCSAVCQKAHRPQHKKECKKRAAELYDEKLFKDHPPAEECPICFLPLSSTTMTEMFQSCCGKRICAGCILALVESEGGKPLCAFCRTPAPTSNEEEVRRLKKLMEKGSGRAFSTLAGLYADGIMGMQQNFQKAVELSLKAGELGCADAYYNLGNCFRLGKGTQVDTKKAKQYCELAVLGGCVEARHNLGVMEWQAGNHQRAKTHYIIAARAGYKQALDTVKRGFMTGLVTKDEYATTLRAYHERQKETKSEMRDKAAVSDLFR